MTTVHLVSDPHSGFAGHGFDWTEYESYWPEAEVDLPVCEVEGCCVFSDAPVACCTDTVGMPVPCQHD